MPRTLLPLCRKPSSMADEKTKPTTSLPMDKEDTKPATSLCMDKENKPATSLPMDEEDTKPATSLCMDKENKPTTLLPCDRCHVVPGTVVDFSHWFAQMASYKCMKCGEMRALFETPEGIDILQDCEYASDVLEDQGSDPETYLDI